MQFEESNRLKKTTTQEQKDNCEHTYDKEFYLGSSTGDYVCTKCGNVLHETEYREWIKKNGK